jgi:hypothetical protein
MNKKYLAQIISWNNAYEKFMGLNSHKLSGKELRGAALLKIHHTTASIMGRMIPDITDPRGIGEVCNFLIHTINTPLSDSWVVSDMPTELDPQPCEEVFGNMC